MSSFGKLAGLNRENQEEEEQDDDNLWLVETADNQNGQTRDRERWLDDDLEQTVRNKSGCH